MFVVYLLHVVCLFDLTVSSFTIMFVDFHSRRNVQNLRVFVWQAVCLHFIKNVTGTEAARNDIDLKQQGRLLPHVTKCQGVKLMRDLEKETRVDP